MIESAISKIKYNFNPQKSYYEQAEEVLKLLKSQMPISIDKVLLEVCIPPQYVGAFYGPFRKFGEIKKEYYDKNSNLVLRIQMTSGQKDKVIDYVKRNTNNEGSYYIVND
jgi:ribosome maturation protein Sdo1